MTEPQEFTWKGIDLESLRQITDKPSDDAVASIFESGSMRHLGMLLKGMAENDDFVSKELPPAMHNLVQKELEMTFSEEDLTLFNRAHETWKRDGMKFVFILFFRALPYTYMAEKPANVLRITKLLETQTARRVFETAQFVFDVMDKHWWKPKKRGILTALKIRIMHSGMRHVILDSDKQGEKWNEEWGKPISQEDLIATNQVFSLEFFKGMSMLGETLSDQEQKAWFHTWKTIGRIMGVQKNLLCENVEEAWTLQHAVYAHLFKDKTISGILLAKKLVEALDHFHMPEKLVILLMKRMLTDEQFPDCFERMLGPSYASKYPEFFMSYDTDQEKEAQEAELRKHFHTHIRGYYETLKDKKPEIKRKIKTRNAGFFRKILLLMLDFLGINKGGAHLIDIHTDKMHNLLHNDQGVPIEELEEEVIVELMSLLGGVMVSLLSIYFRAGKETGFRIPKNLEDNWALMG